MTHLRLPTVADAASYEAHFHDPAWAHTATTICARHHLPYTSVRRSPQGENILFFVDDRFVIKIFAPFRDSFVREHTALHCASDNLGIATPALVHSGELDGWCYLVMTQLPGVPARDVWFEIALQERRAIVCELGIALRRLHSSPLPLLQPALNRDWHGFIERQAITCVERQHAYSVPVAWVERLPSYIAERLPLLPVDIQSVLLHGDVHLGNVLLTHDGGRWKPSGIVDFGDARCGFHEYEFVAPGVLMVQGDQDLQRAFLLAYGYREEHLNRTLRSRLMLLTVLHEHSNLQKYALRLRPEAVTFTLDELEAAIWTFAADSF